MSSSMISRQRAGRRSGKWWSPGIVRISTPVFSSTCATDFGGAMRSPSPWTTTREADAVLAQLTRSASWTSESKAWRADAHVCSTPSRATSGGTSGAMKGATARARGRKRQSVRHARSAHGEAVDIQRSMSPRVTRRRRASSGDLNAGSPNATTALTPVQREAAAKATTAPKEWPTSTRGVAGRLSSTNLRRCPIWPSMP